jgi:hypothetical protein
LKVLTKHDLATAVCQMPGCKGDHDLYLHADCHLDAQLEVCYNKKENVLEISCGKCRAPVALIAVAEYNTNPTTTMTEPAFIRDEYMNLIKRGDQVTVHPHGNSDKKAVAKVLMVSPNNLSIALMFDDMPPFAIVSGGMLIHPDYGVVMMAGREASDGRPIGPWVELFGGGHYEIEPA